MADNYLITGYWGQPHVTAENDRGIHAGIFGAGRYVLPVGEKFKAEYIGNNTIRLYDGKLMDNGAAAGIPAGEYVDLLISNASQGMNRNDLIVFQYSQDASTLIEKGEFIVVQGIETNGTASDPAITQADLLTGNATLDQFPLWRVSVSGVAISAPVKMFAESKTIPDKADSGHSHALTSGNITGVLPVTKGGTGANSVSKARKALGLGETEGALPVENGGTGATTAADARSKLGITPANIGALGDSGTQTLKRGSFKILSNTGDSGSATLTGNSEAFYYMFYTEGANLSNYMGLTPKVTAFGKPVGVEYGGTGATDAATARENLGAFPATGGNVRGSLWSNTPAGQNAVGVRYTVDGSEYGLSLHGSNENGYRALWDDKLNIGIISMHEDSNEAFFTGNGYNLTNINPDNLNNAVPVTKGGTGATTAAQALQNLGIIYSATEPTYQAGAIWLKPVE